MEDGKSPERKAAAKAVKDAFCLGDEAADLKSEKTTKPAAAKDSSRKTIFPKAGHAEANPEKH